MKKVPSAALLVLGLSSVGAASASLSPEICVIEQCVPDEDCVCPSGEILVIGVIPPKPGKINPDGGAPPPCLELVCLLPAIGAPPWIYCAFQGTAITCEAWPQDNGVFSAFQYRWSSDGVVTTDPAGFTGATQWDFACGHPPGPGSNTGHAIVEISWKASGVISRTAQQIDCETLSTVR